MRGFYFITDSRLSRAGNLRDLKSALEAKVKFVQYRNKGASTKQFYQEALALRKICRGPKFIINDRVDIALAVGADGVHLGQDDMPYKTARRLLGPRKIIGITVHSIKQARQAQRLGADYLGVAPIFSTGTKSDAGRPVGIGLIKRIKQHVSIPVVAIGGITLKNAGLVIRAGADGLGAISAVVTKPDVKKEIERFQGLFDGC